MDGADYWALRLNRVFLISDCCTVFTGPNSMLFGPLYLHAVLRREEGPSGLSAPCHASSLYEEGAIWESPHSSRRHYFVRPEAGLLHDVINIPSRRHKLLSSDRRACSREKITNYGTVSSRLPGRMAFKRKPWTGWLAQSKSRWSFFLLPSHGFERCTSRTESYDDFAPVGSDARWEKFSKFHDYLLAAFPSVYLPRFKLLVCVLTFA